MYISRRAQTSKPKAPEPTPKLETSNPQTSTLKLNPHSHALLPQNQDLRPFKANPEH